MYRNYIFDLYGTLVDIRTDESSLDFWRKAVSVFATGKASYTPSELMNRYHKYVRSAQLREKLRHPGYKYIDIDLTEVFRRLFNEKGVKADIDLLRDTAKRFRKASTLKLDLYDGVIDLLESLKAANKRIYLLSNAQESFTLPEMEELDILKYFDGVMISSQEKVCKPQRAFFDKLIERYSLERSECLMIGNDKNADMLGAKGACIDGLYIHQEISPPVDDESEVCAKWKIMDGNVYKIKEYILT